MRLARTTWFGFAAAAAVAATVGFGPLAGAEDEMPGGGMPQMPKFQKKVDHPLAKALVGTWSIQHTSSGGFPPTTGTATFSLGVADTAVLEDYRISMGPMGDFVGHGVWKFSDDGKTMHAWWLDMTSSEMAHFQGPVTEKGFDLKTEDGTRITLTATATGFEFKLFAPGKTEPFLTDAMTKK